MDVSRKLMFVVLLGALVALSAAMTTEPEDGTFTTTEASEASQASEETTLAPTPEPPRNCKNARGTDGVCALRQDCDHSTGPIDRSLYAPKGYQSSCKDGEVCCPFSALVQAPPKTEEENNDSFDDN